MFLIVKEFEKMNMAQAQAQNNQMQYGVFN
jgi:hypothetical protein